VQIMQAGRGMKERNLLVVQGGGPTQVLNTTLAAIVSEARTLHGFRHILGARLGMKGVCEGVAVDLSLLNDGDLENLRCTPGAALGSSRFKPSENDLARAVDHLQNLSVQDLLFIGGNGTMQGAVVFQRSCHDAGYDVRVVGVPKTVDNDIAVTDRCPGYGSTARYVAQSTRDLGMDVRSLPQPVSILETMGRSVGWLAAASAAGKRDENDAPHLVYVPEQPFVMEEFLADVESAVAKRGWAIVVVAEGIRDKTGELVYQTDDPAQSDPLKRPLTGGVAQFLAENVAHSLKMRCRSEKPGLLGRSSMLHVSSQDLQDADLVGRAALRGLLDGETSRMVSLCPLSVAEGTGYEFIDLREVAGVERAIPPEWLQDAPVPAREPFFEYLRPLIGELLPCGTPLPWERASFGDV